MALAAEYLTDHEILRALAFGADLTKVIARVADGSVRFADRPNNPTAFVESLIWDTSGRVLIDPFLLGVYTVATLPAAGNRGRLAYTTDGGVYVDNGTAWVAVLPSPLGVAAGGTGRATLTAGAYLKGNGVAAVAFQAVPIPVADGGTGLTAGTSGGILGYTAAGVLASSALLTNQGLLVGGGAGATPRALAAMTNGQLPIGSTGADPVPAALTAGAGITITNAAGAITIAASATTVVGGYGSIGQVSLNNAGTPNTQFDLNADVVMLRNPSTGAIAVRVAPGAITCNILTAGPAVNGRDQAGAFGASTWLHFYWIWDGTTLATTASTTAPTTGPALPAGYTHWSYAGAVRYNATPLLVRTRILGDTASYDAYQNALTSGTAIAETAVSLASFVPPNATGLFLALQCTLAATMTVTFRVVAGSDYYLGRLDDGNVRHVGSIFYFPNVSQQIFYIFSAAPTALNGLYVDVIGYRLPNGGA